MKKTLIALTATMIAASGAMAATTPTKASAKKPAATKTATKPAAKKPVKKPMARKEAPAKKAPSKLRERLAVNPITGASAPAAPLVPGPGAQFPAPAANPVFTGLMQCELGNTVTIVRDPVRPNEYAVTVGKGRSYTMHQVPTTTGVVSMEDHANGATWLQLGNKSMLMDQKRGERVADGCQNPQQAARDRELQQRPVDLLR